MANLDSFTNIKENISLYFDQQLSKEDEAQLLQQVDNDPKCCQIFEQEKTAREFLKNKLQRSTLSTDMLDSIKKMLHIG
jgi:hypothetical protein